MVRVVSDRLRRGTIAGLGLGAVALILLSVPPDPRPRPTLPDVSDRPEAERPSRCGAGGHSAVLEEVVLCVRGLTSTDLDVIEGAPLPGRVVQWTAYDVLRRGDDLSAAWPTGVGYLRISQGGLRGPRVPLVRSDLPDMLEERQGRLTYHYPLALSLRGQRLVIQCMPTLLPAARGRYVEDCALLVAWPDGLRLTIQAYAGAFYDGGPGWPTLLRDYDPRAWQAALDEVSAVLDLLVLSREDADLDEGPGAAPRPPQRP